MAGRKPVAGSAGLCQGARIAAPDRLLQRQPIVQHRPWPGIERSEHPFLPGYESTGHRVEGSKIAVDLLPEHRVFNGGLKWGILAPGIVFGRMAAQEGPKRETNESAVRAWRAKALIVRHIV